MSVASDSLVDNTHAEGNLIKTERLCHIGVITIVVPF